MEQNGIFPTHAFTWYALCRDIEKKYNFNLTENCFLVSIISKIYNQDGNPARLLLLGRGRWVFHLLFANKEKRYLHLLHIVLL